MTKFTPAIAVILVALTVNQGVAGAGGFTLPRLSFPAPEMPTQDDTIPVLPGTQE